MTKKHDDKTVVEVKEPTPAQPGFVKVEKDKDIQLEEKIVSAVEQHTEDPNVKHDDIKTKKGRQKKEAEVQEQKHTCGECRFYDHSTTREFKRFGIREGLIEIRGKCMAPKDVTKASLHLVKKDSARPCIQLGVYVEPVKEKKAKIPQTKTETPAPETKNKTSKKHVDRAVATNHLASSGDTKVLEKTNGKSKRVTVKTVGEA